MKKSVRAAMWAILMSVMFNSLCLIGPSPAASGASEESEGVPPSSVIFFPRSLEVPWSPLSGVRPLTHVPVPGQDLRITFNDFAQNEPSIAADRYHPLTVLGGFKDFSYFGANRFSGLGVAYSNDGGLHFTYLPASIPLPLGFDSLGGDPSVAFDSRGRGFYAYLGAAGPPLVIGNGIFCTTTTTGGAEWLPSFLVSSDERDPDVGITFEDKPYIALDDHLGSPFRDRAYVSWTRFYSELHPNGGMCGRNPCQGGGDIMVARSADGGITWTDLRLSTREHEPGNVGGTSTAFRGLTRVQGSEPEVASNGDVYVVYWFSGPIFSGGGARLNCNRSVDGGATFGPTSYPFGEALGVAKIPSPLPNESFRTNPFPSIETDPTRPGNVYVVATDDDDTPSAADAANIFFARSTDSGATWQPRVKLNDDGLDRNQFFPWMAVSERGTIAVVWYDTRDDPLNHLLDIYYTISRDGGVTWSPNQRLTDASFEPNTGQFANNGFFGDYIGMGTAGDDFHVLWTDTRRGEAAAPEQETYYDRILDSPAVGVATPGSQVAVALGGPYPNPTLGSFALRAGTPTEGRASLRVVDVSGRSVSVLHEGWLGSGEHTFVWNGRGPGGRRVESGVYFVVFEAAGQRASRRGVILGK